MRENEFEKQVQQKMDELKLHPSDAVWQKIEPQIKKEKRRRWILFFLPPIFFAFLYGGFVLLNRTNLSHENQPQLTKNFIKKNTTNEKSKSRFDSIKNNQPLTENKKAFVETSIAKGNSDQKIKKRGKFKSPGGYKLIAGFTNDMPYNKKEFDTTQRIVKNEKLKIAINTQEQKKIFSDKGNKSDSTNIPEDKLSNQAKLDLITDIKEKKNENVISNDTNKIRTAKNKHSWNWGFSFSGGVSVVGNSIFGSQDKIAANPNFNSPGQINPITPSEIKTGLALITGFTFEKYILPKILFATGFNYKLFSTTNTVGVDSANYFRANRDVSTYHNYFHYIGLPIEFKFQIANSKKTQLYLNTGFSISQLISSNALQFNNATGLYYYDNSQFNKTQIGFNTGFDIAFNTNQRKSFLLGPYFNYSISKIADQGYNKHHFTFIGLRTQFIFRKK